MWERLAQAARIAVALEEFENRMTAMGFDAKEMREAAVVKMVTTGISLTDAFEIVEREAALGLRKEASWP